jgi:hypothetical protein
VPSDLANLGRAVVPYVVLNNEEMNWKASETGDYQKMLASACNNMEAEGYRLVQIEEGDPDSINSPYYFFHREAD